MFDEDDGRRWHVTALAMMDDECRLRLTAESAHQGQSGHPTKWMAPRPFRGQRWIVLVLFGRPYDIFGAAALRRDLLFLRVDEDGGGGSEGRPVTIQLPRDTPKMNLSFEEVSQVGDSTFLLHLRMVPQLGPRLPRHWVIGVELKQGEEESSKAWTPVEVKPPCALYPGSNNLVMAGEKD